MIKMLYTKGRYAPILVCDFCNKRIVEAREGIELGGTPSQDGEVMPAYHVHKGDCDRGLQTKVGDLPGSEELITHFSHLLHNLGLTTDELEKWSKTRDELGM